MYDTTKPYKANIAKMIRSTWDGVDGIKINDTYGDYPVIERELAGSEIDHTDGIGTKGVHHWRYRSFDRAVVDALAMNLNDLATMGAVAYKLQNHLILCEDDHEAIEEVIGHLCKLCKIRKIAVTGGETSIQNNINGMDLSITVSGYFLPRKNAFHEGDVLLGIASSGIHSNGLTLASRYLPDNWLNSLTFPTAMYYDTVKEMIDTGFEINGMVHIAGGGWTRLVSKLYDHMDAVIYLGQDLNHVFTELSKYVPDEVMYKTFNCGIGYVLSVSQEESESILDQYSNIRYIGKVTSGTGKVVIKSSFSKQQLCYQ